jgi:hypothetical protein
MSEATASGSSQRYGIALALLIASMVWVMAIGDGSDPERFVALVLQIMALRATMNAAGISAGLRTPFAVLFAAAIAAGIVVVAADGDTVTYLRSAILVLVVATIPAVAFGVLRQVRRDVSITVHTMIGVLCVYLLMAISFAYLFAVIGEVGSEPFFSQGEEWNQLADYLYYSLITITTVGMGDLTPASDLGRSLTAAEALIGQIYMVTIVAVIVANIGRTKTPKTVQAFRGGEPGSEEQGSGVPERGDG